MTAEQYFEQKWNMKCLKNRLKGLTDCYHSDESMGKRAKLFGEMCRIERELKVLDEGIEQFKEDNEHLFRG